MSGYRPRRVDAGLWGAGPSTEAQSVSVAISGSFRKHIEEVREARQFFEEKGADVLSPPSTAVDAEHDGFTHLAGDPSRDEKLTEDSHLAAIRRSDFLWLVCPGGYLGLSTTFEFGFAVAEDVPVYASEELDEHPLSEYATVLSGPQEALRLTVEGARRPGASCPLPSSPQAAARQLVLRAQALEQSIEGLQGPIPQGTGRAIREEVAVCQALLEILPNTLAANEK